MPTAKKNKAQKTKVQRTSRKKTIEVGWQDRMRTKARELKGKVGGFLLRRPHRSFRQTRRRDYVRSLRLPGYWSFTISVGRMLLRYKKLFLGLALVYAVLSVLLVGVASQDTYTDLGETIRETSGEAFAGDWGKLGEAGAVLASAAAGALNTTPTDLQQLFIILLSLLVWLTSVWLLRSLLAGQQPKLRDGLYNAGAPFVSTFLITVLLVAQLLPVALAALGFGAATASGLLDGGVEAMVFWVAALLLCALSLYWISSTAIALIVVTLPGMYPMRAIRTAGDLVIGRRIRILLRLLWLMFVTLLAWGAIMIPIILFDAWLKGVWEAISWLPVVPVALLVMGSVTIVWSSSYVYLLYRKVVDDDAAPA
jgi:hypothetical protein